MSDVIVDDEVGNDDVESSRDIADDDSASRWTTERAENGKAMSPKAPMQKKKQFYTVCRRESLVYAEFQQQKISDTLRCI